MEDNKMGQLGFKIDTGELATSTIPEDFTAPEELYKKLITMIRKYHPSDDIFDDRESVSDRIKGA
mgnify:CR=1 FL=1